MPRSPLHRLHRCQRRKLSLLHHHTSSSNNEVSFQTASVILKLSFSTLRIKRGDGNSRWVTLPHYLAARLFEKYAIPLILRLRDVSTSEALAMVCWGGEMTTQDVLELPESLISILELCEEQLVYFEVLIGVKDYS